MYNYIVIFLTIGALFGLGSFPYRHLFNEGPCKADALSTKHRLASRLYWTVLSMLLWPVLVLTGLNTALVLSRRKANQPDASTSGDDGSRP